MLVNKTAFCAVYANGEELFYKLGLALVAIKGISVNFGSEYRIGKGENIESEALYMEALKQSAL